MARKAGQIVARGASTWLVRVYLGRDPQTGTRKYHNQTIHGPFREECRIDRTRIVRGKGTLCGRVDGRRESLQLHDLLGQADRNLDIASSRASSDTSPSSRRPRLRQLFLKATVNIDQKTRCATAKRCIRARIRSTISPSGSITGFTGRNTTAPSRRDKTLLATNPRIIQTAA
jgi:hypothetical protein